MKPFRRMPDDFHPDHELVSRIGHHAGMACLWSVNTFVAIGASMLTAAPGFPIATDNLLGVGYIVSTILTTILTVRHIRRALTLRDFAHAIDRFHADICPRNNYTIPIPPKAKTLHVSYVPGGAGGGGGVATT